MSVAATWGTVLVLAIIQGIAEFLPISSSGHLVILGQLLEKASGTGFRESDNLLLNVTLHFGTLLSILVVCRHQLRLTLARPKLMAAIVVATIPAAVIGLSFKKHLESAFSTPLLAGCCLLVTAAFLAIGQRLSSNERPLEALRFRDAWIVGAFQAIALLPGVSRSGSTIAGGLLSGLTREAAAAFSFLIAIPAIGGATLLTAIDAWKASPATMPAETKMSESTRDGRGESTAGEAPVSALPPAARLTPALLTAGAAVSFIVGIAALKGLLALISRRKLHWFAWYCAVAGTATIVWQLSTVVR